MRVKVPVSVLAEQFSFLVHDALALVEVTREELTLLPLVNVNAVELAVDEQVDDLDEDLADRACRFFVVDR